MASIKIVLYKSNKKSDGTYPIVIRVIQGRKPVYHQLGYYIKASEWDQKLGLVKKSHPNSVRLNHALLKKLTEVSSVFLDANNNELQLSKSQIKHKIKHHNKSSFNAVAEEHFSDLLKLKKFNQLSGEKPKVNHFKNFIENEDISFQNITIALLKKFMIYLQVDKKLNPTSVMNCLIVLRTIYNRAIREGLVESKHYPFGVGKIQIKTFETRKVGLNEKEVKQLEDAELTFPGHINARNIWMTSFYLAGVRISDIIRLKWSDINDGRLTYRMGKNQKLVSLKLPEKAKLIIDYYKQNKVDPIYVFPYLKEEFGFDPKVMNSKTRSSNSVINKNLKQVTKELKIDKNISMHIARHTFGQIAGDKIAPQMLQKLYRHSSLNTTIGYQSNFIHNDVDGALDDVLDF